MGQTIPIPNSYFRALCCHKNNCSGIQHFRTFVLGFFPPSPGGCGVFEGDGSWQHSPHPWSLFPGVWGQKERSCSCAGGWRICQLLNWGRNTFQEGSFSLKMPRVLLSSGWVQVCQALGSHRSTDSWAGEKLSSLYQDNCTDNVPVTQCLTKISHFYIFKN